MEGMQGKNKEGNKEFERAAEGRQGIGYVGGRFVLWEIKQLS